MQISKSLPSPLITIPISETVAASPHRQSQCLYVIINSGCWPLARATTRSSNFLCVVRARSFPRRSAHLRFSHESQPTEVDRIANANFQFASSSRSPRFFPGYHSRSLFSAGRFPPSSPNYRDFSIAGEKEGSGWKWRTDFEAIRFESIERKGNSLT